MENLKLNNGLEMPILGFGTMQVKNLDEMIPAAYEAGYRLFDTAANYDNEEEVGDAIKKSGLNREDLFITSKMQILRNGYEGTFQAVEDSLTKLQIDYIDLYLIHQPYGDIYGEWRALEKLYKEGRIRAIGVANFEPFRLMDLIVHNEIVPAVNQIEIHPYCQMQSEHQFDLEQGIQTQAWSPVAKNKSNLFTQPILLDMAEKYGKSVHQVILRWVTQRGISAIPRTSNISHLKDNINIFDFCLTDDEMALISSLDRGKTMFFDHLDPKIVKTLSLVVASPREVGDARPSHDEWEKQQKELLGNL